MSADADELRRCRQTSPRTGLSRRRTPPTTASSRSRPRPSGGRRRARGRRGGRWRLQGLRREHSDQCATWTDLEGEDGKLTEFDINGIELSDLLVDLTDQPPIESAGLYRVQPDYAYRQPKSGTLFVVCTVTASDVPLSPEPGIYIEDDQTLKGVEAPSPETIEAGTSSPVILAFADAQDTKVDGQVTFDLKLGDQATESIGFGLTAPAA